MPISLRIHLVGRSGPAPGGPVPAGVGADCVVVEIWPPHEVYVGRVSGTPGALATASTAWLGVPPHLQRESARLEGRRIRIQLESLVEGGGRCEAQLDLIQGRTLRRLVRHQVACETWKAGAGEIECTLERRHDGPGSHEEAPTQSDGTPQRGHPLGRLRHALPAIFRG